MVEGLWVEIMAACTGLHWLRGQRSHPEGRRSCHLGVWFLRRTSTGSTLKSVCKKCAVKSEGKMRLNNPPQKKAIQKQQKN